MDAKRMKTKRFPWLFTRKKKSAADESLSLDNSDGDDSMVGCTPTQMDTTDSCIFTDELRVFVGTWNVAGRSPIGRLADDLDGWLNLKNKADIYVLGFQEIVPLKAKNVIGAEKRSEGSNWNALIGKALNEKFEANTTPWLITPPAGNSDGYNRSLHVVHQPQRQTSLDGGQKTNQPNNEDSFHAYKLIASKRMVGVFISVWISQPLLKKYTVSKVKVRQVACGIMGCLGNKGSISVSMSIEGTSFCFITAHLASGEKTGDEGKRNHQVSEIFRRTSFTQLAQDRNVPAPITILGHDRIFWFGDLNYRLFLKDNLARELIRKKDWRELQSYDQLQKELADGGVFQGWREGNIEFPPTYKYSSSNGERYSGGLHSTAGEKQRTPAWCDRILWYGKGVKQVSYFRSEIKFSDHRPVSALFSTLIEVVKRTNPQQPSPVALVRSPTKTVEEKVDEQPATLLSLIERDNEAFPINNQGRKSDR